MTRWTEIREQLIQTLAMLRRLRLPAWFSTWSWGTRLSVGLLVLAAYYVIGVIWVNRVDTNPVFQESTNPNPHFSKAIYAAAQLTLREVDQHHWTPADPFFLPGWLLTTMPRFQQGMVAAIGHFAATLAMQDGGTDGDLAQAAGLYKYPATVWRVASGVAWLPTAPSSRQYRLAAHGLEDYDNSLVRLGQSSPVQQVTGLNAMMETVVTDLDGMIERLERHLDDDPAAVFDGQGRDLFHLNRGHVYAWGIVLGELAKDDSDVIAARGLTNQWRRMVELLLKASSQDPSMVTVGQGMLANHLAEQGFTLLRVRVLAGEIRAGLVPVN